MVQRVGIVGCGNIADIYIRNARLFPGIAVVACASRNGASARAAAERHGLRAMRVDDLTGADDVDIVLNLTPPDAHHDVSQAAIAAGKHVYSEKPLAIGVAEGAAILAAAHAARVRIGCAPDTVLGPGVQVSRKLIDSGEIGEIAGGLAAFMSRGMEDWHPNPEFYYRRGGGPVLDMGPYHITALVTLLGPVRSVRAAGRIGVAERTVVAEGPRKGARFRPEVMTTINALLSFRSGAEIAFLSSWDVRNHGLRPIELYGTGASLRVPDPDFFGGCIEVSAGEAWTPIDTRTLPLGAPNHADPAAGGALFANYRGVGLAEMAHAIETGRPHRCNGDLAFHVLTVMEAILESAVTGRRTDIQAGAERPAQFGAKDIADLGAAI